MLPLRSRIAAGVSALALGLPLGAGALAVSPAAAASAPGRTVGVASALRATTGPATSSVASWARARRVAETALDRAQRRLAGDRAAQRPSTPARTDFTLTLRDLRAGLRFLDDADRRAARRILARPTQGQNDPNGDGYNKDAIKHRACTSNLCVWWVTDPQHPKDLDPPPATDTDANNIPDQVDLTLATMDHVWQRIVTKGHYRAPLPDRGYGAVRGGDDRLDIYLANIGDEQLFGYCAPELAASGRSATGYCVLDNDYAEFVDDPADPGAAAQAKGLLEVTAAHEFFHAVQFAYDVGEDDWFMEGTAMWMEDEIYTDVNDNVRYLQGSQLTSPTRSLDQPAPGLGGPYVSWIFWRYLTERYPDSGASGLPLIMRDVWNRAQAYTTRLPRTYSMRALNLAVKARGSSLTNVFALFGEANRHPETAYSEGVQQNYPRVPAVASFTLSRSRLQTTEKVATMAHMTNYTVVFTPDSSLASADWFLRVPIDAPPASRGSRAQVTIVHNDGTRTRRWVSLDRQGNGVAAAPFRYGKVRRVEVTLTNAGQRYRCNQGTRLSCQGASLDNGLRTSFRGVVKKG